MWGLKGFKQWLKMRQQEMEIQSLAIGINSSVNIAKDMHIIMLDYDTHDIEAVKESVWELQNFWNLSDAHIYRTKNGHHAFFWHDLVPYERLKMIINYAKGVDQMYKYISRYYDHKTIRVAGKYAHKDIKFVMKIAGTRSPNAEEIDLGSMKKGEHEMLLKML